MDSNIQHYHTLPTKDSLGSVGYLNLKGFEKVFWFDYYDAGNDDGEAAIEVMNLSPFFRNKLMQNNRNSSKMYFFM